MPAQPNDILRDLNRSWVDDNGRPFSVSGDVRTANLPNAATDLANDMPLIIGTLGHAMVLTALTYTRDLASNGQVTMATVRDPWPGNGGRRDLSPTEWGNANFLVQIRVF